MDKAQPDQLSLQRNVVLDLLLALAAAAWAVLVWQHADATMLLVILAAFLLAACGQSEPPAKGQAGPPGPPGPLVRVVRPASLVHLPPPPAVRRSGSSERLAIKRPAPRVAKRMSKFSMPTRLNPGGAISFIDERNVSFRPKERSTALVLACIDVAEHNRHSPTAAQEVSRPSPAAAQEVSVEDRACITAAAAKLPNVAALLRLSEAVRCRNRRPKDGVTRTCPTSRWKLTSAWPDRVQRTSLTASDKAS
jgi:hypothetical protein